MYVHKKCFLNFLKYRKTRIFLKNIYNEKKSTLKFLNYFFKIYNENAKNSKSF